MKYYQDENGRNVPRDLIQIRCVCKNCDTTFWSEVRPLEEMLCPNEGCQQEISVKLFTVKDRDGQVKLPYRFRYPEKTQGFIPLSFKIDCRAEKPNKPKTEKAS